MIGLKEKFHIIFMFKDIELLGFAWKRANILRSLLSKLEFCVLPYKQTDQRRWEFLTIYFVELGKNKLLLCFY